MGGGGGNGWACGVMDGGDTDLSFGTWRRRRGGEVKGIRWIEEEMKAYWTVLGHFRFLGEYPIE
jgi:hypothetical protein